MKQPNRRTFHKQIGGMGLTAMLANVGLASGVRPSGQDTVKVGLIGCGGRGTGATRQLLDTTTGLNFQLTAMADAFEDRLSNSVSMLKRVSKKPDQIDVPASRQFVGLDAYQKLLQTDVDVVVHATPPGFRPQHAEAIVEAGKHLFLEKPVAVDPFGVDRVIKAGELAKQKNLAFVVGFQRRFEEKYRNVVRLIQDGGIGQIQEMSAEWKGGGIWTRQRTKGQSELEYQINNWYYFTWLSGESIVEQNSHNIDVCLWAANELPTSAIGFCDRAERIGHHAGQIQDEFIVEYDFASGILMTSHSRQQRNKKNGVGEIIKGSRGEFSSPKWEIAIDGKKRTDRPGGDNPYQNEQQEFAESIESGRALNNSLETSNSVLVAIMGRTAAFENRRVTLEEVRNSNQRLAPDITRWNQPAPTQPDKFGDYQLGSQMG